MFDDILTAIKIKSFRLENHHLILLIRNLNTYHSTGIVHSLPHSEFEIESDINIFSQFDDILGKLNQSDTKLIGNEISEILENIDPTSLNILLGQRITPASVFDKLPPDPELLARSSNKTYRADLTVAARAWSKHAHRSEEDFWGEIKGTTTEKNEYAANLIDKLIQNHSWWNIFGHYRYEDIYEIRVPTGHGCRWTGDGEEFIGFVEPFYD